MHCCSSAEWARRVSEARPYPTAEALFALADRAVEELSDAEIDQALSGHPRIGDRANNPSSAREQSAVASADDAVRENLRAGNEEYEKKFGHVYLVCASGRSAQELLAILHERLRNGSLTERRILRRELAAINRLRLEGLLDDYSRGVR